MARLLLVDDDTAGLELRKLILEREGHQVSAAADVAAARSLFLETRPDSVVLDLRLPETEALLADGRPIAEARAALLEEIHPIDDMRSTADYRRRVAANLLEQFWRETA